MKLTQALSVEQFQKIDADGFQQLALEGEKDKTKVRLAKAYQRSIRHLESDLAKVQRNILYLKSDQNFVSKVVGFLFDKKSDDEPERALKKQEKELLNALGHMVELRDVAIPPGILKGLQVVRLQNRLAHEWLDEEKRNDISGQIVTIFETTTSYEEMYDLRATCDAANGTSSRLHKLVYSDLDIESSHKIIRAINENVQNTYKTSPEKIKYSYMIYSDIDDTIKASLNDRLSKTGDFYPGALAFYKQLGQQKSSQEEIPQVNLTFLSARPDVGRKVWDKDMKRKLPQDMKFFALYGSLGAFGGGIVYYVFIQFIKAIAQVLPEGFLKQRLNEICKSKEVNTFISFALDKRINLDRDLLLRPEVRPIVVGDCGEGDLIFLLTKNCGVPLPFEDPRVPKEYRGDETWHGSLDAPGNPTHKPLYMAFAHALSSATGYGVRPDPKHKEEYLAELHTKVFNNYVDNALYCLQHGIFDQKTADKVVEAVKEWVNKEDIMPMPHALRDEKVLEALPPDVRYRQQVLQSLSVYYKATHSRQAL